MNRLITAVFLASSFLTIPGRSAEISPGDFAFFEKEIRPILVEHCYQCHSKEEKIKGGLLLDSRLGLAKGGDSGKVIVKGNPEKSLLIEAVRYHNRDLQMPPKKRLSSQKVSALEKWVTIGAPDPREDSPDDLPSQTGMSIEEGKKFWSFLPVANPPIPEVPGISNPIDAFILARLREEDLSAAPRADRRTLIRRVTFNLTGLPPTPEEVDAFLADTSENAFEKVIDRLLDSPHYGERWGRRWLDVARYADSNGLDENLAYGQAWRYRDYVVNSFNKDKPYDRFLIEQLAGDLLPGADQETKTATAFLALGAKVLAEPDLTKLEMDIIDEQLDTLGKAFLGMTLGCVRCHDHKFDPLKQTDYYALAAIFRSTASLSGKNTGAIKYWYEHTFTSEDEKAKLKEVEAEIKKRKSAASGFKSKQISQLRTDTRNRAADYLAAAVQLEPGAALSEAHSIAAPKNLHPRILHHCRMHLDYHRDDPFYAEWHRLRRENDSEGVRVHYGTLFREAESALTEAKKKDPKTKTLTEPRLETARAVLYDLTGLLAVPAKPEHAFDQETIQEYHRLMDIAREFESAAEDETAVMGVSDGEIVSELALHIRGSHNNLGDKVAREFPEVMRLSNSRPVFPAQSSGRLELAQWMADTRHPLTARVMVNRIWGWHFGQALAKTTENFGILGDRPSHPDLLDWLARRFMANDWSIKQVHRLILTSKTWQQASTHPEAKRFAERDPENRFLWRSHIHRLEAEEIRDSVLAVSNRLDRTMGGKTVPLRNRQFVFNHTSQDHTTYESLRRAIYLPVIRNNLYTLFEQFDYPDPTMPTGSRNATFIAPQALVMMNDTLIMESADAFASRLFDLADRADERVEKAWEIAYARKPSPEETQRALYFLKGIEDCETGEPADDPQAWSILCQSLLASNEFFFLR